MKYIIEFDDEPLVRKSALHGETAVYKAKWFNTLVFDEEGLSRLKPYEDSYQKGIDDAISTVKWLFKNVPDKDLFDGNYVEDILNLNSYQEIKDGIERYEMNKNAFFVGDEVKDGYGNNGVVTCVYASNTMDILWNDGSAGECFSPDGLKKTGRNFKQISELIDLLNSRPQSPPEDMEDPCVRCKHYNVGDGEEPCESCKRHHGTEERWEPES